MFASLLPSSGRRSLSIGAAILCCSLRLSAAPGDQTIYVDALQNGWQNWSWATVNFANTSPVHLGADSISVSSTNWQALYLHHNAQSGSQFSGLTFWVNGGASGGQLVQVQATRGGTAQVAVVLAPLPTNSWRQDTVFLDSLAVATASDFDGFWLQVQNSGLAPTFYVDDITLVTNANPPAAVTLTSPASGANFLSPATINLAATVVTNGHIITKVQFYNGATLLGEDATPPYTNSWNVSNVGTYSLLARVVFDGGTTADSPAVSITVVTNSVANISVNAAQNQHPINPYIYGVAFASSNQLADLNVPINRSGGNTETRYNWLIDAHNHAADWYFESLADDPLGTPAASTDTFIANSKNGNAQPMITIPMLGWVPKLGPNRARLASYAITNYGLQADNDWQYFAQAGNGVITNTSIQITTNNPNDANFLTNSTFQQFYVQHLTNRWGISTNGGVRYYLMDNEETIWHGTHRDVHPVGTTMVEIRDKFFDYAGMVKSLDPSALVMGPEEWGWSGYFYSGYDQQWSGVHQNYNPASFPDRSTNGGWDYGPWLLNQFYQRATNTNQRLLDYFTFHIYPQGANEFGNNVATATQLARNKSTRALWDPGYVDASWINSVIQLIPRMKNWVAQYYPGTKTGITEYNWGAENHINGATAQADILGIFGREGLDLATRWTTPDASTPTYKAMKMFRNYDGNKSGFGDTSVAASGPNPDIVSTFAAIRSSDGAMTVVVINKQLVANALANITITNFLPASNAQVWQLTAANSINHLSNLAVSGNALTTTLPPQSITLFVMPVNPAVPPKLRNGVVSATNSFNFWLDGIAGQRYAIQGSSDLVNWTPLQTNTLATNSAPISIPATNAARFYRAQWVQ